MLSPCFSLFSVTFIGVLYQHHQTLLLLTVGAEVEMVEMELVELEGAGMEMTVVGAVLCVTVQISTSKGGTEAGQDKCPQAGSHLHQCPQGIKRDSGSSEE